MSISATYQMVNTAGVAQSRVDLLQGVAVEAIRQWSAALAGDASLTIRIEITDTVGSGRADGTWGNGTTVGNSGGFSYAVGAPAFELQGNGSAPAGEADIVIRVAPDYLINELYLDPTPGRRGDTPTEKTDALSVMLHEIGHALGFTGYYDEASNTYSGNFKTGYDYRIKLVDDAVWFDGPNVRALLGGMVPLTEDNHNHYGNSNAYPGDSTDPLLGLMNGVVFFRGYNYAIGDLDLAMLADTGIGTRRTDILDVPFLRAMRGGAGNDRITGGGGDNLLKGDLGHDRIHGSAGADVIYGGSGNDVLFGDTGNDRLIGGLGSDRFVFDRKAGKDNADRIADFAHAEGDLIVLSLSRFAALGSTGPVAASAFHAGSGVTKAHDASDRLIYDTASGELRYDPDGAGGVGAGLIATLADAPSLAVADFLIMA